MSLACVTITGADDSTPIEKLVELSQRYPFVEWGILVSRSSTCDLGPGVARFPSRWWQKDFFRVALDNNMKVATHVCGAWVRELYEGNLVWPELPLALEASARVQLNTHGQRHVSVAKYVEKLRELPGKNFIFQFDGVNDHLLYPALMIGNPRIMVSALFDGSHGAGVLPQEWPKPKDIFLCGYAGGLGPENVVEQVRKIEALCLKPFWIDMETRVRTADDRALDLEKVERVLVACEPLWRRIPRKVMDMDIVEIRGAVARGWCDPKNSAKVMDTDLAEAISQEVRKLFLADRNPYLGCATTEGLIAELAARAYVAKGIGEKWPTYRTVDR